MGYVYWCWFIPSVLSFIFSAAMAINIILTPRLRMQYFQRLSLLLAITDMIQSGSWFLAHKYSTTYRICAVQEYMLQFGGLGKASVTCLICGLALYIASKTAAPSHSALVWTTIGMVLVPFICCSVSMSFKTARVFCTYYGDVDYSDASESTRDAVIVYIAAIFVPVYVFVIACATFSIMLQRRVGRIVTRTNLVHSGQATEQQQLMHVVARMRYYPIIVVLCWLPSTVLFIMNLMKRHSSELNLVATVFLASSGIGVGVTYFSYQRTYPPFIMQLVYAMSTETRDTSLIDPTTRGGESLGGSWSEGPSSSAGSNLTGTLSEVAMARTSTFLSAASSQERGRTYSLAQSLLPRFLSRSRSTTTGPTNSTDSYFME